MGQTTDSVTVTVTATRLIVSQNGLSLVFGGQDIIRAEAINAPSHPNVGTVPNSWFIRLYLTGTAREVYLPSGYYDILLNSVSSPSTWNDKADPRGGALVALAAITPMIRSAPSGGGGGQVDTIVAGDAIDVDSTDPVNPIVNVKVDGVTIGFNGSNELEVPAGGGGYVPTTRLINTTAPISGGGDLSANRTITHDNSGVSAASYTNASVTVDAKGHVTAASSGAAPVTSVGATYPIQSSGGATPTISADTSLGGNGAADDGKVLIFGAQGQIIASSSTADAIEGIASNGIGVYAESSSAVSPALEAVGAGGGPIAHFHDITAQGMNVLTDGGLDWTSGTGAQTTANNLPVFGALTQGMVPAAGAVPAATNFLTETGVFAVPAGAGDVVGPASATDKAIARYNTTTGKLIQNSGVTVPDALSGAMGTAALVNTGTTTGTVALVENLYLFTAVSIPLVPVMNSLSATPNYVWSNMPAALTWFMGAGRWRTAVSLVGRKHVRVNIDTAPGGSYVAGSKIRLLYRTQAAGFDTTITNWVQLGASAQVEVAFDATTRFATSAWLDIATLAMDDVLIAVAGIDGDGASDPQFISVGMEYR